MNERMKEKQPLSTHLFVCALLPLWKHFHFEQNRTEECADRKNLPQALLYLLSVFIFTLPFSLSLVYVVVRSVIFSHLFFAHCLVRPKNAIVGVAVRKKITRIERFRRFASDAFSLKFIRRFSSFVFSFFHVRTVSTQNKNVFDLSCATPAFRQPTTTS